jgi:hypothetical protein
VRADQRAAQTGFREFFVQIFSSFHDLLPERGLACASTRATTKTRGLAPRDGALQQQVIRG